MSLAVPATDEVLEPEPDDRSAPDPQSPRRFRLLRAALRTAEGRVGAGLLLLVTAVACAGPTVARHTPEEFVARPFAPPSAALPFGADNLGRDVLARFLAGGRTLLLLAVCATVIGVAIGVTVGLLAGTSRTWRGDALVNLTDLVLVFPQIVLALLFLSLLGPQLWLLAILVGITHVPRVARVVRVYTADVVQRDFVASARALGVSRPRILFGEILPNVTAPILVEIGLGLAFSAALIGTLSFLGFGIQPPAADWGLMINENQTGLTVQPWGVLLPTIAIAVITVGANLLTDAIARASGTSTILGDQV